MNRKTQEKLNHIVDVLFAFQPTSVRLLLPDANESKNAKPISMIRGLNNTELEVLDNRLLTIMRNQNELIIPDLEKSPLFTNLSIPKSRASLHSLRTDAGFAGILWLITPQDHPVASLSETVVTLSDCIVTELNGLVRNDLTATMLANNYVEFLDNQNTPAMIYLPAESQTATNMAFESLADKDRFFKAFRNEARGAKRFSDLIREFNFNLIDVAFPNNTTGKLFLFNTKTDPDRHTRFNTNELDYFRLMVKKAQANLKLMETSESLSKTQLQYVDRTNYELNRLETILQFGERHYHNFLTPEEGVMDQTNIATIVRDVVSDLQTLAKTRNFSIDCSIEEIEGAIVQNGSILGDPWLLTLSVYNILDNAIRYTRIGGESIRVSLTFTKDNWQLSVKDSGTGISPFDLERIAKDDIIPEKNGDRIHGLDFVKYAMRLHRGKITIESRLGQGTTVQLSVPIY